MKTPVSHHLKTYFFMDRDERTEYLYVLFWTLLVQSGGLRQSYLTTKLKLIKTGTNERCSQRPETIDSPMKG